MFVGCALSCVRNMARAFSPRFLFRFDTWGNTQRVSPGWYEAAPLAMNDTQISGPLSFGPPPPPPVAPDSLAAESQ